mmetsp:Transcript_1955/g.3832  ORF Transcript_1955/g.3832 Transcript_1955/m.3832 type:complete len:252 (-) Transcript_1955:230-985(-)
MHNQGSAPPLSSVRFPALRTRSYIFGPAERPATYRLLSCAFGRSNLGGGVLRDGDRGRGRHGDWGCDGDSDGVRGRHGDWGCDGDGDGDRGGGGRLGRVHVRLCPDNGGLGLEAERAADDVEDAGDEGENARHCDDNNDPGLDSVPDLSVFVLAVLEDGGRDARGHLVAPATRADATRIAVLVTPIPIIVPVALLVAVAAVMVLVHLGQENRENNLHDKHDDLQDTRDEEQHCSRRELAGPLVRGLRGAAA